MVSTVTIVMILENEPALSLADLFVWKCFYYSNVLNLCVSVFRIDLVAVVWLYVYTYIYMYVGLYMFVFVSPCVQRLCVYWYNSYGTRPK